MIDNQLFAYIIKEQQVCLGDIGGFLAKEIPTYNNKKSKTLIPPTIKIFFSENLKCDNTEFIFYLSKCNNLSFFEAKKFLDDFVKDILHQLKNTNKANLGLLGILEKNNNQIIFIPSEFISHLERFGFEEIPILNFENEISKLKLTGTINPTVKKYFAAASLVISLLFVPSNKFSNYEMSSLAPIISQEHTLKQSQTTRKFINKINNTYFCAQKVLFPTKKEKVIIPQENTLKEKHISTDKLKQTLTTASDYYGIVVGAFKGKNNAMKLKNKLSSKYNKITVKKTNNFYRVIIGIFNTRKEALDFNKNLSNDGINGWLTKH